MTESRKNDSGGARPGLPHARFRAVLLLLLGTLFWLIGTGVPLDPRLRLEASGVAVVLVAVVAAADDRRRRRRVIAFAALTAIANGGHLAGLRPLGLEIGPALAALFVSYTSGLLLMGVVRSRRVTGDVLAGALAAFVMAGLSFGIVYAIIELYVPGAISVPGGGSASLADLVYFSFVTMLTIGFGEVTPALPIARAIAVFEGLFGVIYTTVVMAALVAAYVEGRHEERR